MKLFIFEPHDWDYCGGVIAMIANSFDEAVDLIIRKDIERVMERIEESIAMFGKDKSIKEIIEMERRYKRKYFARSPEDFEEKRGENNWLLTNEFNVPEENVARIVVDDWNYA